MTESILLIVGIAFATGATLIACASFAPALKAKAPELWSLYLSEFLIVGAFLIPAALGGWFFGAVLVAFCWRGQAELFRLFDSEEGGAAYAAMVAAAALILVASAGLVPALMELAMGRTQVMSGALARGLIPAEIMFAGGVVAIPVLALFLEPREKRARSFVLAAVSLIFPALFVALIAALRAHANGFLWLVLIYGTVEINDAFALVFGKLFGRTLAFPKLSPRKTVEGLIGGIAAGLIAGALFAYYAMDFSVAAALRITAVIIAMGIAGDLVTSALKRARGKKDFAPVLTQHGGVLDIYDSLLFAAPVIYLWQFATP